MQGSNSTSASTKKDIPVDMRFSTSLIAVVAAVLPLAASAPLPASDSVANLAEPAAGIVLEARSPQADNSTAPATGEEEAEAECETEAENNTFIPGKMLCINEGRRSGNADNWPSGAASSSGCASNGSVSSSSSSSGLGNSGSSSGAAGENASSSSSSSCNALTCGSSGSSAGSGEGSSSDSSSSGGLLGGDLLGGGLGGLFGKKFRA
ncbi:hypothetical protein D0863_13078 [Hortaea werneckii]|uniref:Uncharacterized protein n=1 Tax=Hortaea werneckii TaxID=91943 RepID=A0A3M7CVG9_HORWE|nr:hypothetical protein D0863_13078 [Hortaea werneckii]